MIDIKMMARKRAANGTGAAKTTTGGSVVYQQNVDEARHAQQADKAIFAEQANKALEANAAARASYANKAQELAEDSTAFSQFLRKDKADTAQKLITFLEGIGLKDGHGITAEGMATLLEVVSANFNEAEQRGFGIHRRADGKYQLSITDLIVWGKAVFNELELRRLSYVGGNMVFSACGSKITKVEDKGSAWRCYFRQDDGTTQTQNLWQTDDLARAETFNLKGKANHHYWRRVTGVGEDWIELSKTDCEQGSDAPQVDDALVQMGNKTRPERQGLIMLRTTGEPAIIIYSGINGYTLEGKAVALLSPSKVDISASIFRLLSPSGSVIDLKGKDGRDGKSSYTFTRYSDDGGKTFTKAKLGLVNNLLDANNTLVQGTKIRDNYFSQKASGNSERFITFFLDNTSKAFAPNKTYCIQANVSLSQNNKDVEVFIYDKNIKSVNRAQYLRTNIGGNAVIRAYIKLADNSQADWSHVYIRFDNNGSTDAHDSQLDVFNIRVTCVDDLKGVNQLDLNATTIQNNLSGNTTHRYFTEDNLPCGATRAMHVESGKDNDGIFFPNAQFVYPNSGMNMVFSVYMRSNTVGLVVRQHIEGNAFKAQPLTPDWKRYEVVANGTGKWHSLCLYTNKAGDFDVCCPQFGFPASMMSDTWKPSIQQELAGTTSGTYLGIASWDKPYPPLDTQMYQWSSTTDKEAMKKAQEAIKTAETASSAATTAATKANDATKRAGEVELKMQQGEFIVRADKTRFQNNKGQDVAVFNADGTINARAIMAKGTGGTAYFGLYNDAPAMIFTNASGQTTALMTNQGILKPADCVITLRDTKGSMLFKEMYGTTIRAYFTYYIAIRVVNTGFQRTLFGDDTLDPHAQLSLSARFEEYAGSDMQLQCVEPKWIEPQKEQTIVYRATTDHLYPKRYLSAETEFRVSWYAAFEGKVIMAGNFNAREAASKGEGYVSFDY